MSVGFLSSRVTRAWFSVVAKTPVVRDLLMISDIADICVGAIACPRVEEMGSRGQVVA